MTEAVCFMCGAAEDEVDRLFRGVHGWICAECVQECTKLMDRESAPVSKP